ncbi:MMPL family transporter [Clostridium thermobutyricum]|uniref:MMPL family transporter n=1 Tax=Clostridium thermobutyricum TaxID=29372 RepID=UPI0018ABC54E|nr:MMPL family transporter [Clostridium thermobutyricum]
MKKFFIKKNLRWVSLIVWTILIIALALLSPSLTKLVREKGAIVLPSDYPPQVVKQLSIENGGETKDQYIAVFNVPTGLTTADENNIKATLNKISKEKDKLHISSITDCFSNTALKPQMISKNNTTILAIFNIHSKKLNNPIIRKNITNSIKTEGVKTYLTGNSLIEADINIASQKGLGITTTITVIFIFLVLFIVFRSFIIPFVPLTLIILSYIVSQFVVAIMSKYFNFPVSNYTQVFMICILFGMGTDYCILLISRFKEELDNGLNKYEAIKLTYKTAGKTVLFSATPIFIVFTILYFVQFSLYKSASSVSISVIFLILALFTLFPSIMAILGHKLFFPFNKKHNNKENKVWSFLGKFALTKPILALLLVIVVCAIPICLDNGVESFNLVNEISSKYPSIQGFNIISNNFGIGKISPITIYIANDKDMKSPEYVETIAKISDNLEKDPEVKQVMSLSQPLGTRLDDIYVDTQAGIVNKGMKTGTKDLSKIGNGLSNTSDSLKKSEPQLQSAIADINKLDSGTLKTKNGVIELQSALSTLTNSINLEANASGKLKSGVQEAENKLSELKNGEEEIQQGYNEVGQNLNLVSNKINTVTNKVNSMVNYANNLKNSVDLNKLNNISNNINSNLQNYIKANPSALKNKNFRQAVDDLSNLSKTANSYEEKLSNTMQEDTTEFVNELNSLNSGMQKLSNAMNELNSKSTLVTNGISEFQNGINEVYNGLNELNTGLNETNKGGNEILSKIPEISNALGEISNGQSKINSGFQEFSGKINELSTGLGTGAADIDKINNGIKTANGYINKWSKLPYGNTGVYVPQSIFNNSQFKEAINNYLSPNGKLATITVTLKENPYSNQAMNEIPKLKNIVKTSIIGTNLSNAQIGEDGLISLNYNIRSMANHDYYQVMVLVTISVLIALIILLRSLIMPVYILISIVMTYFTSLGIVQLLFQKVFGYVGLNWITLFFGFVILVSLGIDYSIFIITRFKQTEGLSVKEGMLDTIKVMGKVIMSAAVILGGTFAALIPSGVLILAEIALVVIVGLFIYVILILPIFIPIMAHMFNKVNFWPYDKEGNFLLSKKNKKPDDI